MPDATQAKIDVLNEAFLSLGGSSIQTFEDEVEGVEDIERRYNTVVGAQLSHRAFGFSVARVQLSKQSAAASSGYAYNFVSPVGGDIAAVYETADGQRPYTKYRVLNGVVNMDLTEAWAEVMVEADPNAWPAYLRQAIVACLKAEFCVAVTGDDRREANLMRIAYGDGNTFPNGGLVGDARQRAAQTQGGGQIRFGEDELTSARYR